MRVNAADLLLAAVCIAATVSLTAQPAPPSLPPHAAKFTGDLNQMIERRMIRAGVAYNKTGYFIDRGVQRGAAYESMKLFEDELNANVKRADDRVHIVFIPLSREALGPALLEGRVDIIAAQLTITDERKQQVDFTNPTRTGVNQIVVTAPNEKPLSTKADLSGREVFVRPGSLAHESVTGLSDRLVAQKQAPIQITLAPEALEDEDLLEMANAGLVRIVIVDDYLARFWKQIYTGIVIYDKVALRLDGAIAPAIRKNSPQLMAALNGWIKKHGPRTAFGNMMATRYTVNPRLAKSATSDAEIKRFQSLVEFFKKYSDRYKVDYLLVAAQGYQESGLDQSVKSPVGAIGVMQVMPATGKELAVGDIAETEANIHAGVKYIRFMIDRYYKDEPMDDLNKGLFAFASYNAGPARVRQLRAEAAKRGLDPNRWFNHVEQIASERIGRETVTYVANIYKYYIAYRLAVERRDDRANAKQ